MLQLRFKNLAKKMIPKDCNQGKHFFINSEFCDKCDIDFDTWYTKVVEEAHKEASTFLLSVLQSILNEQQKARLVNKATADYIYQSVREQTVRNRFMD